MSEVVLEAQSATIQFGGLKAVDGLNLKLNKGRLYGLIGPNGAGKTTAFNLITGIYKPTQGAIFFKGTNIQDLQPHQISKLGMSRTFQNIRLFHGLTVLENACLPFFQHKKSGYLDLMFQTSRFFEEETQTRLRALEILNLFNLEQLSDEIASNLPYGSQRKLEIVRALMSKPSLLLLDEPAAGMNHAETHQLMLLIEKIRKDFDITILLIEHDMKLVMGICEHIYVLDHGVLIAEGEPQTIRKSHKVIEAYLGADA